MIYKNPKPIVSVCIITYNHEKYISEAIDSVLSQVTSFPIEIIISDDCSNDDTPAICHKYAHNFKNIIFSQTQKNMGPWFNLIHTFELAQCNYIALLEGDDYWTDNLKLQTQITFLENNNNYSACFSDFDTIDENKIVLEKNVFSAYNLPYVIKKNILELKCPPTRGIVIRKEYLPKLYPDCFFKATGGDTYLFAKIAENGPIHYIKDSMAVWRIRPDSLFSGFNVADRREIIINDFLLFHKCFNTSADLITIQSTIIKQLIILSKIYAKKLSISRLIKCIIRLAYLKIKFYFL